MTRKWGTLSIMLPAGFSSEWRTIADHRVHLSCRDGFPDYDLRRLARATASCVDRRCSEQARLVEVARDERSGVTLLRVVSTLPHDEQAAGDIASDLAMAEECPPVVIDVLIVRRGDEAADGYNHTRHLVAEAERFRLAASRLGVSEEA